MNFVRISRHLLQPICERKAISRRLFTKETLDVLSFEQNRANALQNIENPDVFKTKLQRYLKDKTAKSLDKLMKSLDVLVHIISPTKDDYHLLEQTLIELIEFPEYSNKVKGRFGHHVMKALYSLNALDTMREFYYHPKVRVFFKGFQCTLMYFDLAYKNGNYKEIFEMDKIARSSIWVKGSGHFKLIDVLVIASCYKLNTKESYTYADYLWIKASEFGYFKKTAAFMATFALEKCDFARVFRIADDNPGDPIIELIKLKMLIQLGMHEDMIKCISSWATDEMFLNVKISKNLLDKIVQTVIQKQSKEAAESDANDFELMLINVDNMVQCGRITDKSIDDLLDCEVTVRRKKSDNES